MSGLFEKSKPLLRHLDIELTERCNNACLHCYINLHAQDHRATGRELSTEQWKDILRQAADLGALSVRMTGGEPLLRKDFAEIYLYARRLGMMVMLFTNARLITPELADLFARVPPLKKIEITVYGMRPESYDSVTCSSGAFAEFRKGVDLLMERKIPFVVKSALLPQNINELEELEEWVDTMPWIDTKPTFSIFFDLRTRRDSPAKNRMIKSLRFTPEQGVAFLARNEAVYRHNLTMFCSKYHNPPGERLFTCDAGTSGCVDAYGFYQMCMMLRHPNTVVDLSKSSLREALTEIFPRIRELKTNNPEYLRRCAQCFLKNLCEQCPAKSWAEHGTLDTPVDYYCEITHAHARFTGLLKNDEKAWEISDWQERIAALASSDRSEQ